MERERDQAGTSNSSGKHTTFVPLLLIVIALLLMTGFQMIQLTREHELLNTRLETQVGPLEESQRVRDQLQSVAVSTATLARNGNENAARIVEQLEKSGIKINDPEN